MRRRTFLAAASGMLAGCATQSPASDPRQRLLHAWRNETGVPGVAVVVKTDAQPAHVAAAGLANMETGAAMTARSTLSLCSVTKLLVASLTLQLVRDGLIGLDDDVSDHLGFVVRNPAYPNQPLTIDLLLSHTSSLRDGDFYDASYVCGSTLSQAEWIALHYNPQSPAYDPSQCYNDDAPGDRFDYANAGYGMLGCIVESVTGRRFGEVFRDRILTPMGMTRSSFDLADVPSDLFAMPYLFPGQVEEIRADYPGLALQGAGRYSQLCRYVTPTKADGMFFTCAQDLAGLVTSAAAGSGPFAPVLVEQLTEQKTVLSRRIDSPRPGDIVSYGRGCFALGAPDGSTIAGHPGDDPGVETLFVFDPEQRWAAAAIANARPATGWRGILDLLWKMRSQAD